MRPYITFDCETDPFKHGRVPQPFLWVAWGERGKLGSWRNTPDFVEWLKQQDVIAYAHNGGKFDFHFILDYLDVNTKIMLINGRIAKAEMGLCEIRDSWLVLPVPLAAYQKDEIDYDKFEKEVREKHMREITAYALNDVKYLYEVLDLNFKTYGQKLTLAGTAFAYWNKRYNAEKAPDTSATYFEKFKPFYYGGRVECFHKGPINHAFKMFDINSAYPYAMLHHHPWGDEVTTSDNWRDIKPHSFVTLECISKGAFPYREKGKLLFPWDNEKRIYKITGWEYLAAKKLNALKEVRIIDVTTHKKLVTFKEYVNEFFNLKKNTDKNAEPAKYLLVKLYLNSLYGKFGQSSLDHEEFRIVPQNNIQWWMDNCDYRFIGECGKDNAFIGRPIAADRQKFYNVATAASITGFVRAFMFKHIHGATDPLYCDTDSLACKDFGGVLGKELGEWGCDGDFVGGAIAGKKMYAFLNVNGKYKISSKGVKLTAKEIINVASGEMVAYKNSAPTFSVNKQPVFVTRNVKLT